MVANGKSNWRHLYVYEYISVIRRIYYVQLCITLCKKKHLLIIVSLYDVRKRDEWIMYVRRIGKFAFVKNWKRLLYDEKNFKCKYEDESEFLIALG